MSQVDSKTTKRSGRIKDARGRVVAQLDPIALHLLRRHDVVEAGTLKAIASEDGVKMSKSERGVMVASILLSVILIGVVIGFVLTGRSWDHIARRIVPAMYIFVLPFILWGAAKKRRVGRIAAAMLKHRRCPHCGYDLRRLKKTLVTGPPFARNAAAPGS